MCSRKEHISASSTRLHPSLPVVSSPILSREDVKNHMNLPDDEFDRLPVERKKSILAGFIHYGYAYDETPETNLRWSERFLRYYPGSSGARLIQAKAYQKMGEKEKAAEILLDILHNAQDINSITYLRACQDLAETGKLDEAEKYLSELVQMFPRYIEARFYLGKLKVMLGKKEEAITIFRALLEEFPRGAGAKLELGKLLLEKGEYGEAENLLLSAADILKVQPEPFRWLADLYIKQKKWKSARKMLELYKKYKGDKEVYQDLSRKIPVSS
ncbi:MAG: tetratricopeptide repeat protein [bacterium JZ-2024 1]